MLYYSPNKIDIFKFHMKNNKKNKKNWGRGIFLVEISYFIN